VDRPRAGVHYPRSLGEFEAWFRTDADCMDYLEWLRWPSGFVCPRCRHPAGWQLADQRWECAGCHARTSVTAGTIFDRTRTPLTVWFTACWMFATSKSGASALALQRALEIGSYQTAWTMLHRLRSALVRPGREQLSGTVEVNETYIGGDEPGLQGGRAKGKKVLTAIAVESTAGGGLGRCRMAPLANASGKSLNAFVTDHVQPGATVVTDGWQGYRGLPELGYIHEPRSQRAARARGEEIGNLLPGVHRIASLVKRWLLSTHQSSATPEHLPSYLNEFVFRFNRRRSRSHGMIFYRVVELAVAHQPVPYKDIIATKRPRRTMPTSRHVYATPPSLERHRADRPWRRARQPYSG
jgi:transposase-like protein